jgi:hypothetical protein
MEDENRDTDTWETTTKIEVLYSYQNEFYPSQKALELYNELARAAREEEPVEDPFELSNSDEIPRHDAILLEVYRRLHPSGEFGNKEIEKLVLPKKYENHYLVRFDETSGSERVWVYHARYVVDKIKRILKTNRSEEGDAESTLVSIENVLSEPMYTELCFQYR